MLQLIKGFNYGGHPNTKDWCDHQLTHKEAPWLLQLAGREGKQNRRVHRKIRGSLWKTGHIILGALLTLSLLPLLSSYLVSMWIENLGRKEHWGDRGHGSERGTIRKLIQYRLLYSHTQRPQKVDFSFTPFHHISLLAWHSAADQISALCHISYFILWFPARKVFSFSVSVWGETPRRLFLRYHNRPGTDTHTDQTNAPS